MDHVLMKVMELKLYVSDIENSREKSIILTKLDEIRHWATDLKAKNPKPGLVEELTVLENLKPLTDPIPKSDGFPYSDPNPLNN